MQVVAQYLKTLECSINGTCFKYSVYYRRAIKTYFCRGMLSTTKITNKSSSHESYIPILLSRFTHTFVLLTYYTKYVLAYPYKTVIF